MNYNWNIRIWLEQYIPLQMRKPVRIALSYALIAPVQVAWDRFIVKKTAIDFDTMFSGETICVEEKLNILFDPVLKRIQIATNDDAETHYYIYNHNETIEEAKKVYVYKHDEAIDDSLKIYIYGHSEILNPYDFTVYVPNEVYTPIPVNIKQEIEKYRFAGKRYQITLT